MRFSHPPQTPTKKYEEVFFEKKRIKNYFKNNKNKLRAGKKLNKREEKN